MADKEVVYRVADVQTAAELAKRLDKDYPPDKLVGLGVIAKGYLEDPEEFYVFANAENFSADEMRQLHRTMAEYGAPTDFGLDDLWREPRPHLQTTGPIETILPMLQTYYPDADI